MISRRGATCPAVVTAGAAPSYAWNPNELQTRYFEINGTARWRPKGALQTLVGDLECRKAEAKPDRKIKALIAAAGVRASIAADKR